MLQSRRRLIQLGLSAPFAASQLAAATPVAAGEHASPSAVGRHQRERNKALVRSYIAAIDNGDMALVDRLVSPQVQWWIVSRGDFDRDLVMQINQRRYSPDIVRHSTILGIAAEGDRVAVEFETATTRDAQPVFIVYHHLFECRDDQIVSVREWTDPRVKPPRFTTSQAAPTGLEPWPEPAQSEVDEAQTRAIATAFLEPGEQNLSADLVAPGYRWWVNGRGYDDMFAFFAKLIPQMMEMGRNNPPVRYSKKIAGMTVEGERAAVLIHTDVIYPEHDYINRFHVAVRVRNGKVIEMREHTDRNASEKAGFPDL